ncbi:MAG: GAF domain-containing protein [Deltaproteobacteria bacterium]|nr:GAF domain-containing protein [Deltaproteobacteria bacterium]RLB40986.1 MAG: phosphohydrolase [Deltaproteobacteria bacterium]
MLSESQKIDLITQISLDINEVKDLDVVLERILTQVRRFFNADAGSIYLKEGDMLRFTYTQNETLRARQGPDRKLIYSTFSLPINNQSIAGFVAHNREVVNLPDVYRLEGSEPYTFDSDFDEISRYRTRSVLAVPMTNQRGEVLGVMQLINAQDDQGRIIPFSRSDETVIRHFATTAALAVERAQMTRNIILRMISMAELRDPKETGAHVNRVGSYSVELYEVWARKKGIPGAQVDRQKDMLRMAAMLHDVGKVAISDLILKKPARLTEDEFELMKSHTFLGARLFREAQSEFDELAAEVALNHHEKWDGTGYPGHIDPRTGGPLDDPGSPGWGRPKRGEEIPLFGRIVAVADVYDALRSRRVYKEAWDEDRILEEMEKGAGTHFDPEVVEAFFDSLDVLKSIAQRYPDEVSDTETASSAG